MGALLLVALVGGDVTDLVDRRVEQAWTAAGITPAPPSGDEEFLRRVTFDLAGRPPTTAEIRAFRADGHPDKRVRRINALMDSPDYARHWASLWEEILVGADPQFRRTTRRSLYKWLRDDVLGPNLPYDRMVAALIGARGITTQDGPSSFIARHLERGGPEALAGKVARAFLGIRIQCAQCHDHPFDRYSQADFYGLAAFFARVRTRKVDTMRPQDMSRELYDSARGEMTSGEGDAKRTYAPVFLNGGRPGRRRDRRAALGRILAADPDARLARALINRVWAILFGRGIIDPVDDISPRHRPSHPELLDDLSLAFVRSGYDLKALLRGLTATRAYQLSSRSEGTAPPDRLFAVARPRAFHRDQLAGALSSALGIDLEDREVAVEMDTLRQALLFMNQPQLHERIGPRNRLIDALFEAHDAPADRLDGLFLGILSRPPRGSERTRYLEHLSTGGNRREAYEDVAWVLINSSEFLFNH